MRKAAPLALGTLFIAACAASTGDDAGIDVGDETPAGRGPSLSGGTPGPVSETSIITPPSALRQVNATLPSRGVNLTPLERRLRRICSTRA